MVSYQSNVPNKRSSWNKRPVWKIFEKLKGEFKAFFVAGFLKKHGLNVFSRFDCEERL